MQGGVYSRPPPLTCLFSIGTPSILWTSSLNVFIFYWNTKYTVLKKFVGTVYLVFQQKIKTLREEVHSILGIPIENKHVKGGGRPLLTSQGGVYSRPPPLTCFFSIGTPSILFRQICWNLWEQLFPQICRNSILFKILHEQATRKCFL